MTEVDASYFSTFEISTTVRVSTDDGETLEGTENVVVSASSLSNLVAAAVRHTPPPSGEAFCAISHGREPQERFTSAEHIIPEGLGYGWARLPRGVGTCDRLNSSLSRAELEWLRFGSMGMFRPFYVSAGKARQPPEYHAPSKSRRRFSFVRSATGRRCLEMHSETPLSIRERSGPGELAIRTVATDANPVFVSLAVHKLAFLTLWLHQPPLAFDPALLPLRRFLEQPEEANFRVVFEKMIAGAAPGVQLNFLIALNEVPSKSAGATHLFKLTSIWTVLRVHHMLYFLSLCGEPFSDVPSSATALTWMPLDAPVRERNVEIQFGIGGIRKPVP